MSDTYKLTNKKKEYNKQYYLKNKKRILERTKIYMSENKEYYSEKGKEWYKNNKERHKELTTNWNKCPINREKKNKKAREWGKNNKAHGNVKNSRRRTSKLNAIPKWLTKEMKQEIKEIYQEAQDLQWLNEEPLHVDHIIPLRGKNVCGLHVPWNLQILTSSKNLSKGNSHE